MVGAIYEVDSGEVEFNDFSPFFAQLNESETDKLANKLRKTLTDANRGN